MLVHTVLFYLKDDLTPAQRQQVAAGLETLKAIKSAQAVYIGTPAKATALRPVVESTYDFALTVLFQDLPAHDAYQVDPIHKAFGEQCSPLWRQVRVFDAM